MALTLRWAGLLPNGALVAAALGLQGQLEALSIQDPEARGDVSDMGLRDSAAEETPAAAELRRSIQRALAAGSTAAEDVERLQVRLNRVTAIWQRVRSGTPLVRAGAPAQALPLRLALHIFVDHIGSNTAEVSWIPLGESAEDAEGFEVRVRRYRIAGAKGKRRQSTPGAARLEEPEFEHLGTFAVPGGGGARRFVLRRLLPAQWHRVRVRALGPKRCWESDWSEELSLKTLSMEQARAAGLRISPDSFFAPSERQIRRAVTRGGAGSAPTSRSGSTGPSDRSEELSEVSSPLAFPASDGLLEALGPADPQVVKNLLDARLCKDGQRAFVRLGTRYSRPANTREERVQRLRLIIAAKELYNPEYSESNPWSMGPLYYEQRLPA